MKKTFDFEDDYVTCTTCLRCTGRLVWEPTFCQEYSLFVEPYDDVKNQERAANCAYWLPKEFDVTKIRQPEHDRYYEKDSMA